MEQNVPITVESGAEITSSLVLLRGGPADPPRPRRGSLLTLRSRRLGVTFLLVPGTVQELEVYLEAQNTSNDV